VASPYARGILHFTMKTMSHFLKTTQGQFLASVGLIIVVLFGYYFYSESLSSGDDKAVAVIVTQNDHVRGAKDGQLTLVEFGDFQCPACGAYEAIVRQVLADNKDTLKISFKHFPLTQLHRNALLAAKASEAAAIQGKFWEMHDIIYDKQAEWSETLNARDFFFAYATTLGLDTKKFLVDLDSKNVETKIMAEYKEGEKLGVQGTPTFFLNGKKLEGVGSLELFNKAVKSALVE
jgi:formate-nitrite transporter family protein